MGVIEKLLPRQNELVRPPVANVTQALILIAPVPKPDFLLIDKLLIKYFSLGIKPILVINKIDLTTSKKLIATVEAQYQPVCQIVKICAHDGKCVRDTLEPICRNELTLLTGQSAVGKTSALNALLPDIQQEIGGLSAKTDRGKNTTRHSEIFVLQNGGLIVDSPGFSAFVLESFTPEDILDYTVELAHFSKDWKYNNCNHIAESPTICAVKRAVDSGELNRDRYIRFCEIYKIAKEMEDKKYE